MVLKNWCSFYFQVELPFYGYFSDVLIYVYIHSLTKTRKEENTWSTIELYQCKCWNSIRFLSINDRFENKKKKKIIFYLNN